MKIRLLLALTAVFVTGCATRGYDGPTRPSNQVATVYFKPEGRVSLQARKVNGIDHGNFNSGIEVPAGNITAYAGYQLASYECPMFSVNCLDEAVFGHCNFSFNSTGGRSYEIEMKGAGKDVSTTVIDRDTGASVGSGSCEHERGTFHNSIERRRSTIGE